MIIYGARIVEPIKRNKDGVRWIVHRFPIKGGITFNEAIRRDLMNIPSLLEGEPLSFRGIPIIVRDM